MFRCPDTKSVAGKVLSALLPVVLLGCSSFNLAPTPALAQSQTSDASSTGGQSDMDSQLMFELMIAELAGRRGQLDVAMSGYLRAAERTDDPRVSERATRLAMFGRQWGEAERVARRWINLDPDNSEAPQILGQSLLRQEKTDEAASLFTDLLEGSADRSQLLRDIQFELQRNDNPATAVAVMQVMVERFDDESEAHLGLSRAYITSGDSDAALASAEVAVERSPKDPAALLLRAQILSGTGKPEEAFTSVKQALDADPGNTQLRLGYAQLLVEGGRYELAGVELDQIHGESKDDADTMLTISLLAIESRRLDHARLYLTDLLASGAYPDQANFYLGRVNDSQKEYEQAIDFYDAVMQGDLQFTAQIRAAELTAQIGELENGRARLQKLASVAPNPAMQRQLVTSESRMLQYANQDAEAVLVLNEGLERFPNDNDLLYARALAAHAAGDDAMMIDDLNTLIEMDPENAHAMNALGYHYADENTELELAENLLVKANQLIPGDPAIMDSLGWLRFRQGSYSEAIDLLRAAYKTFPDPEIAAHLAQALWLSGSEGEAQDVINTALEENPDDEHLLAVKNDILK